MVVAGALIPCWVFLKVCNFISFLTCTVYPNYGDLGGAWAPSSAGGTLEHFVLEYAAEVSLTGIDIFETYHGGHVRRHRLHAYIFRSVK